MDFDEFHRLLDAVVTRFLAQNTLPPLAPGAVAAWAEGLRALGEAPEGWGGEWTEAGVQAGVAGLLARLEPPRPELAGLAKQLIKGCHQADVAVCRESYRETDTQGRCRRQEREYDRARVSGAHCVDCPHWRGWEPAEHARRLEAAWHAGGAAFAEGRAVFLPEDFRALRRAALRA